MAKWRNRYTHTLDYETNTQTGPDNFSALLMIVYDTLLIFLFRRVVCIFLYICIYKHEILMDHFTIALAVGERKPFRAFLADALPGLSAACSRPDLMFNANIVV